MTAPVDGPGIIAAADRLAAKRAAGSDRYLKFPFHEALSKVPDDHYRSGREVGRPELSVGEIALDFLQAFAGEVGHA